MRAPRRRPTTRARVASPSRARSGAAALVAAGALLAGACSSSSDSGATGGPAVEQGSPGSTADTSPSRSTLAGVRVTVVAGVLPVVVLSCRLSAGALMATIRLPAGTLVKV